MTVSQKWRDETERERLLADAFAELATLGMAASARRVTRRPRRTLPGQSGTHAVGTVSEIDEHGRALAPATTTFTSVNEPEPSADAERLERLLSEPRSGADQLYVAQRDVAGRRHRCRHPINYLDTASGRVYTSVVANTIGEDSIIATPATGQTLIDSWQPSEAGAASPDGSAAT